MGSIPSHAVELLPLVYQTGREMIGCRGQALSPLSLERSFRHRDSKFNWFTVWLRENWLYDCKLPCALIVGHEIITPMFWFWDMDIDTFKCPRVGGKVRSDVCFPALTCSLLEKVRCIVVPSWSLVLGTHHCWYLSRPQSYGPCQGFHLHPFIETLSETLLDCALPELTLLPGTVKREHHSLSNCDPLYSHTSALSPHFSLSWGVCKAAVSQSAP